LNIYTLEGETILSRNVGHQSASDAASKPRFTKNKLHRRESPNLASVAIHSDIK